MGQERRLLRHASRMAVVTLLCRITGYVRDKALYSVLGTGFLYDAYRTANRIPNAFRGLFAEGTLHAAFVPTLSQLVSCDDDRAEARELFRGLLAVMVLIVGAVVALGILLSPWLVRLFAEGFVTVPGKLEVTVLMNRIMFPYLLLVTVAALFQAVLNSHERFLLAASTPLLFNLVLAAAAWLAVPRLEDPTLVLAGAVLVGGLLQAAVQAPAVRRLGFAITPMVAAIRTPGVGRVLRLMLPGIPVLGINQINQLISNRFASFIDGGVSVTYGAYRVTELVFGAIVVQMTTVLLPLMSRELREDPEQASGTLLGTVSMVSFVTLPAAVVMAVLSRPIIGLLFGGGRFTAEAVAITGATLTAYAFSLVGTGHVKVMASAFFAQKNTTTPMWGSLVALVVFTVLCWRLVGPLGAPGLGWANTVAMATFGLFLTALYLRRFGADRKAAGTAAIAIGRQVLVAAVVGVALLRLRPWLGSIDHTSLDGALRMAAALGSTGLAYAAGVTLLGGREIRELLAAVRSGGDR
ncbi:MAG: murein biosynthesis integral membrane protein MurJ [Thermoanaerobaculales bacterium]|jgi:putative peptidoglycan lipid II flippase|nr:murein biosynthesis integral membrane protein MurJ [Thermoanaerobaculales bacterium]